MTAEQRQELRRHCEGLRAHCLGIMMLLKKDEDAAAEAEAALPKCRRCNDSRYIDAPSHEGSLPRYGTIRPCPLCSSERLEAEAESDRR